MVIQWSDADQVYIVSLPEFGPFAKTHGETYAKAVKNGEEALQLLMERDDEDEGPLPEPIKFGSPIPDEEYVLKS